MKITDVVALARDKAHANESTFPNSKFVIYFKAKVPQYQADIEKVNEGFMGSIEHRDLKATGTGEYTEEGVDYLTREYNLPADMIDRLDHVYAKLDGINWVELMDLTDRFKGLAFKEDIIKSKFSNEEGVAGYKIFRRSLFLLCGEIAEDVTNGLEIWTFSFPDLFSSIPAVGSADDVEMEVYGIPEQMQELLAMDLAIEWKQNREKPIPLTKDEQLRDIIYNKKLVDLKGFNRSKVLQFDRPDDGYANGFNL